MSISPVNIELALSHVNDPELFQDLITLERIDSIEIEGNKVSFTLLLPQAFYPLKNKLREDCINAIHEYVSPEIEVEVRFAQKVKPVETKKGIAKPIKHIIGIASGKGGVGKSTIAANLSIALAQKGFSVGLLDADIYGPSLPTLFKVSEADTTVSEQGGKNMLVPPERYGVKLMSIGFLVKENEGIIWRGPMASNALKQLYTETFWGALDFLIIDLPPGTGDIQLTLAEAIPIDGIVMVSTPQKVAIADVKRAVDMFLKEKKGIPILGFVENMAYFVPKELSSHKYYIFGKDGCKNLADEMNIRLLAQIPIVQSIAETSDMGEPIALQKDSIESGIFAHLATELVRELSV